MMYIWHVWQIQEAKAKLTQLIKNAMIEPQIISRRGVSEIVVMSIEKYEKLLNNKNNFISFIKNSPLNGLNLEIKRDGSYTREIDI